jgi:hypothetical protein
MSLASFTAVEEGWKRGGQHGRKVDKKAEGRRKKENIGESQRKINKIKQGKQTEESVGGCRECENASKSESESVSKQVTMTKHGE